MQVRNMVSFINSLMIQMYNGTHLCYALLVHVILEFVNNARQEELSPATKVPPPFLATTVHPVLLLLYAIDIHSTDA